MSVDRSGSDTPRQLPSWLGYSVGHWDGDTLVVDTVGFNDKTWPFTFSVTHLLQVDTDILESVCSEGNRDLDLISK